MKTVKIVSPRFGPNVKAYKTLFGHGPSAEDMKWRSEAERGNGSGSLIER